jgi:hypothetical protein
MTTGEVTSALVLDGLLTMSAAQLDELRPFLRAILGLDSLPEDHHPDSWMGTRAAADYLGMTTNAVHRMTAKGHVPGGIPFEQPAGPGGKCYFQRSRLDAWRRGDSLEIRDRRVM